MKRRNFIQACAISAAAISSAPILGCRTGIGNRAAEKSSPAGQNIPLDQGWLFGGKFKSDALAPGFDDTAFSEITLPHCVTPLSWQNWDPASWQDTWIYRRHFKAPADLPDRRVFLEFDGVMVGATPSINGHTLEKHLGGYLPFRYELTEHLREGENVLALQVDSRWTNVPPEGAPIGAKRIDYLEAGGIHRPVRLKVVPGVFLSDLFVRPVKLLDPDRYLEVVCTVDAASTPPRPLQIQVELTLNGSVVSRATEPLQLDKPGPAQVKVTLSKLGNVALWDVDTPHLYHVTATLLRDNKPVHSLRVRTGLREARFALDGFFLNGRRLQLFGLNRHEVFPYVGFAMPARVMRRDAEILRHDFNCNMVRCSHYPQSPAFLDACDELGLLVWEEVPGWGYIGDANWKDLLVRDVHDMILRDRNRPSVVIWGTRVNESANDEELYGRTRAVAKALDDSRPTSGSMTPGTRKNWQRDWHEEVFAFDDYHAAPDGTVGIDAPTPGVPYFLAEAVGQFNYTARKGFDSKYRRAGDVVLQQQQALRHAQAHSKAAANPRICGVIAWCGFDYASLINPYNNVKCPGVADVFRIPKLGAAFYQAQGDPKLRPVIQPNFYWDFGPQTPRGPGQHAAVFSNCDRLDLFIDGRLHATVVPDRENYPHLKHPPFFTDLDVDGTNHPELRIDGFLASKLVLSRSFSSDPAKDQLSVRPDDTELAADGSDATRVVFKVVDKFGAERLFAQGEVRFELTGPGVIIGDNPFALTDSGGVGAVWLKTIQGKPGTIVVRATHSRLGTRVIRIRSR